MGCLHHWHRIVAGRLYQLGQLQVLVIMSRAIVEIRLMLVHVVRHNLSGVIVLYINVCAFIGCKLVYILQWNLLTTWSFLLFEVSISKYIFFSSKVL